MSSSSAETNEPFWWFLFAAGGQIAAFVTPAMITLFLIAAFVGPYTSNPAAIAESPEHTILTFEAMRELMLHPLAKLVAFLCISLPFFHVAHRIKHTLHDVHFPWAKMAGGACYGGAIVASTLCAVFLVILR